ncbi:MAG: hypothetical protein M3150_04855 [Pseudomonadota bacterium]|nr:hypothetical protein [Pseudomonadota bacterium]
MVAAPKKPEIDHRTIKLLAGLIAIFLPILTSWLAYPARLTSVSASYFAGDWPRSIFIGFLFAIAAFLAAYNGRSKSEMICSKVAAMAAFLIAMFPCDCDEQMEIIPGVHYAAAAVMFGVLAFFCRQFYRRAMDKGPGRPRARGIVYAICGVVIVLSIALIALNGLLDFKFSKAFPQFVFWCEAAGLMAFGVSWLFASHVLPLINAPNEKFSPLRANNPP